MGNFLFIILCTFQINVYHCMKWIIHFYRKSLNNSWQTVLDSNLINIKCWKLNLNFSQINERHKPWMSRAYINGGGGVTEAMTPSLFYIPLLTVKGLIKWQCPLDVIYPTYFKLLPPLPSPWLYPENAPVGWRNP